MIHILQISKNPIHRYALPIILLIMATAASSQQPDPAYHNPDEINAELERLVEDFPDWMTVDSIGHSSEYDLPIMMAKLSDNPLRSESEPALLFIGQVHAEELIGIEIVLELMTQLLENLDEDEYRRRLEGLELYFIPTANPEGLRVVHSGQDVTFRKNCRDNIGDGRFRYQQGAGGDTSGVDLNRNFGLHWDRGDTLFQRGENQYIYNYYRGPAPFSEPETRAVRDLMLRHRFLFSICYHSSRSGQNSELVIQPWYWDGRYPPDDAALNTLGDTLASLIPSTQDDWSYDCVRSTQRVGQEQEWAYQAAGTFMYLIEAGSGIQPDSSEMRAVVAANLEAAFFLMDLALCESHIADYGILEVSAEDADSQEPLEAFITVENFDDPVLEPRRTSGLNGRFYWLLPIDEYYVEVSRFGYASVSVDAIEITEDRIAGFRARLEPLEPVICRFRSEDIETGEGSDAIVMFTDRFGTVHTFNLEDGHGEFEFIPGIYDMEIYSLGYVPLIESIELEQDLSRTFYMFPSAVVYREDFYADRDWQRGGSGEDWEIVTHEHGRALTESPSGAYPDNMDTWLLLDTGTEIAPDILTVVEVVHRPYFEPGRDYGILGAVHPDIGELISLASFSSFPDGWVTTRLRVDFDTPGDLVLGLSALSDNRVGEDGWLIDRISVYQSTIPYALPPQPPTLPEGFSLVAYPNPFNCTAQVVMYLPVQLNGTLGLYNHLGRRLVILVDGKLSKGEHRSLINGICLPSGQYYLWFNAPSQRSMVKMTVIK